MGKQRPAEDPIFKLSNERVGLLWPESIAGSTFCVECPMPYGGFDRRAHLVEGLPEPVAKAGIRESLAVVDDADECGGDLELTVFCRQFGERNEWAVDRPAFVDTQHGGNCQRVMSVCAPFVAGQLFQPTDVLLCMANAAGMPDRIEEREAGVGVVQTSIEIASQ